MRRGGRRRCSVELGFLDEGEGLGEGGRGGEERRRRAFAVGGLDDFMVRRDVDDEGALPLLLGPALFFFFFAIAVVFLHHPHSPLVFLLCVCRCIRLRHSEMETEVGVFWAFAGLKQGPFKDWARDCSIGLAKKK